MANNPKYIAKAFVSCSLREEDKRFVNLVCRILKSYRILPFGTVGKFSASTENPATLMKRNIPKADLVVICATPRYTQEDVSTGKKSMGLSEMVHVETGMAFAQNKPVVVFVKEGTHVGSFIPNVTQYIELNGKKDDIFRKRKLIRSLLLNACKFVKDNDDTKILKSARTGVLIGFALYGFYKLFNK